MATRPPNAVDGRKRPNRARGREPAVRPFYRIHAHTNPLADKFFEYPVSPDDMDWGALYPSHSEALRSGAERVEVVDVGCGWGGLIVALSELFPDKLVLGLEIRERVVGYTRNRIDKIREDAATASATAPGGASGQNVGVLLCNCMKQMPCYFRKGQLSQISFTFPDPHFKKGKQRRRIINPALLAEYAYVLASGGKLYVASDVEEVQNWMVSCLEQHPMFRRITGEEEAADKVVPLILSRTEESQKVDRSHGKKWSAIFRRV